MAFDVLSLLSLKSALLKRDDDIVRGPVFDVLVPVVREPAGDAMDLLVLGGELPEVVGDLEEDDLVKRVQRIRDDVVDVSDIAPVIVVLDLPAVQPDSGVRVPFLVLDGRGSRLPSNGEAVSRSI